MEIGSWRWRIYWLWSLLFVQYVFLVLLANYNGCTSSILNPPCSCLLFPFSSKQQSKSVPLRFFFFLLRVGPEALRTKTLSLLCDVYFCTLVCCIFYLEKIITWAQRISSWNAHTQRLFFIWDPQPNSCIPNAFSWKRWGLHSQMYYLRSSCVLSLSISDLRMLSHHSTICPPCEVNICFFFLLLSLPITYTY